MKVFNIIAKIVVALAAVAGVVYVVATYGEQIVAWAKKVLASLPKCPCCEEETADTEAVEETPAEEVVEEEAVEVTVEVPAEAEPVAEEADFEA